MCHGPIRPRATSIAQMYCVGRAPLGEQVAPRRSKAASQTWCPSFLAWTSVSKVRARVRLRVARRRTRSSFGLWFSLLRSVRCCMSTEQPSTSRPPHPHTCETFHRFDASAWTPTSVVPRRAQQVAPIPPGSGRRNGLRGSNAIPGTGSDEGRRSRHEQCCSVSAPEPGPCQLSGCRPLFAQIGPTSVQVAQI